MACNPAPACTAAINEANRRWPERSRASDGICASAAHSKQNPTSDHETGNAVDITHDPAHGCDGAKIVAAIISNRDPRVKYLIFNGKYYRGPVFLPAPYTGKNRHESHVHISIYQQSRQDTALWFGKIAIDADNQGGQNQGGSIDMGTAIDVIGIAGEQSGIPGIGPLIDLAKLISDGAVWIRVAEFVAGLVLFGLGLALITADSKAGATVAGVAAAVAPI